MTQAKREVINRISMRQRLRDARPGISLKILRSGFLMCAILYLCIYHLRRRYLMFETILEAEEFEFKDAPLPMLGFPDVKETRGSGRGSSIDPSLPSEQKFAALLRPYHPRNDPVLADYKLTSKRPAEVHLWTASSLDISAPTKFLIEGVERSLYLKLVHISFLEPHKIIKSLVVNHRRNRKAPLIWIVDLLALDHDCHSLETLLSHALELNMKHKQQPRVLTIDFSGSPRTITCPKFQNALLEAKNIPLRMAQRSIVHGRFWNPAQNWVELGRVEPNPGQQLSLSGNILHSPLPVRESVVAQVTKLAESQRVARSLEKLRPVDSKRPNDIVFFWRKGDNAHYANLRREVAQTIMSVNGVEIGTRTLRTLVRFFGDMETIGSTKIVFGRYVKEMMATKVVVVAQRDEWEDHYRLMESLASGALVVSDVMVGLPEGLVHGKNIVFYNSTESLHTQLLFYLDPANDALRSTIAKSGWELVMGHHRCWHRVEELVFGSAKTAVSAAYDVPPSRRARDTSGRKDPSLQIEFPVEELVYETEEESDMTS